MYQNTVDELLDKTCDNPVDKFRSEVLNGLMGSPKKLQSKYFYDAQGDVIFQQIMSSPEYYLTKCEQEIFKEKTAELAMVINPSDEEFDLIELGAGDGTKSQYLLSHLVAQKASFTYLPIDISINILNELKERLADKLPELDVLMLHGEYFEMLAKVSKASRKRKVVMFLGANIGNMVVREATLFCQTLRDNLNVGDFVLIGFDLKKHPRKILGAYDDKEGITARFNLNLLKRINRELDGNFDLGLFEHYQTYDPGTGSCKSYLVSLADQAVVISGSRIHFALNETIFMEVSQKYSLAETEKIASQSGFVPVHTCLDSKGWFADSFWKAV